MLIQQQGLLLIKCKGVMLDEENNKSIINLGNGDSYISKNNMGSIKE